MCVCVKQNGVRSRLSSNTTNFQNFRMDDTGKGDRMKEKGGGGGAWRSDGEEGVVYCLFE